MKERHGLRAQLRQRAVLFVAWSECLACCRSRNVTPRPLLAVYRWLPR